VDSCKNNHRRYFCITHIYIYYLNKYARKKNPSERKKKKGEDIVDEIEKAIYFNRSNKGFENHKNGIAFERKNWNIEKQNSMLSILSSGSKSPIDIVAIRKDYVLLITCKENSYLTPKERKDIEKLKRNLPKFCRIQLRCKKNRKIKKMWL
jgi:hypothetical protein